LFRRSAESERALLRADVEVCHDRCLGCSCTVSVRQHSLKVEDENPYAMKV
jgi:hypothetical protein